jgi:hypothetical protein
MSKKPYKSATQMDEELAEFTDRILSDQSVEEMGVNEELRSLQGTVSQLKAIVKNTPDVTVQRIEKQLMNEWHKNQDPVEEKPSTWQKFLSVFRPWNDQPQQRWVLGSAFIVLFVIFIFVFPINQFIAPDIQATAGDTDQYRLVLFVIATILVIGLLWFGRNKS